MFGLRRVVGMGLIFESPLVMGMNVMPVFLARFCIGRRICRGRSRCLDGGRNRQLGLRLRPCCFLRGMTVVMLLVRGFMGMVRMLMNMLVRMLMAFLAVMIRIRMMPGIVGVSVPIFAVLVVLML